MMTYMIVHFVIYDLERNSDMAQRDKKSGNCPSPGRSKETFIVKVDHCEHETWQGRVTWAEENKSEHFRSALELIKLMDGAIKGRRAGRQNEDEEKKDSV